MPDSVYSNMFVAAEGQLAEHLCQAEVFDLTPERAEQLREFHAGHHPAVCLVLAATLLETD